MFLSRAVYERAPFYWVILGALAMVMGTYLGATSNAGYYLAGTGSGALFFAWGLVVFRQRLARDMRRACNTYEEYLEQVTEPNP